MAPWCHMSNGGHKHMPVPPFPTWMYNQYLVQPDLILDDTGSVLQGALHANVHAGGRSVGC